MKLKVVNAGAGSAEVEVADATFGRAFNEALEPKRLVLLEGGHFDAYIADFDKAANPARDWFVTHLMR